MINFKELKAKIEDAIRQYEEAIAEFDAFIEEQGLGAEFAAFVERAERNIEEKKMVLDEAEDTGGNFGEAKAEEEEEKKKESKKPRMCL